MAENKTTQRTLEAEEVKGISIWVDAWRRLRKNKLAVLGGCILIVIVLLAVFADFFVAIHLMPKPEFIDFNNPQPFAKFSASHWFGTDAQGRDLFSRVIYGGRVSLEVGFLAAIVSLVIGVAYGAISGFAGGKTDETMMRFVEIMYGLPLMFFIILAMVIFGRKFWLVFVCIGIFSWMTVARITRGQILTLKNNEYVEAARSIGVSRSRLIFRHLIPNASGPIIVYLTLNIPGLMLTEAFLSFLGLGVQAPMTSWGVLATDGGNLSAIQNYPWLILAPGFFLFITLFSLNMLGEGLRDALDPSMKNRV